MFLEVKKSPTVVRRTTQFKNLGPGELFALSTKEDAFPLVRLATVLYDSDEDPVNAIDLVYMKPTFISDNEFIYPLVGSPLTWDFETVLKE